LKGENARWRELAGRFPEKLECVEAVELGSLRLRQVDDENVKPEIRGSQEEAAVGVVNMDARVRAQRCPRRGEVFLRQIKHGRIQLHVINPFQAGVLQSLGETPVHATANKEKALRRGVLEQRKVHRLFGSGWIGNVECNQPILVEATRAFGLHDSQVAVNGIARGNQIEAAPQPLE